MIELELLVRQPTTQARPIPLLFIHGAWHGAWCWDEYFLPYFAAQGYASYALSLRGHGGSAGRKRIRWYSIEDYIDDVEQVVSQLPQPPVLIGHSMGGYVVQKYLEKHSVPAAVLVASIPKSGILPWLFLRYAPKHPIPFLKSMLGLNPYALLETFELAQEAFFSPEIPIEKAREYYARTHQESARISFEAGFLSLPKSKGVTTSMLVIAAGKDRLFTVSEEAATARAYQADFEIFPEMSHDMMLEPGWQAVADKIIAWLGERGI
jgi:pimeloyl-ACP methyl ester carboxylesterase